jgi:hypothetical protein
MGRRKVTEKRQTLVIFSGRLHGTPGRTATSTIMIVSLAARHSAR